MAKIKEIHAGEILNARGIPTIETTVILSDGITATASCPSGISVSSYEAAESRDHDIGRFQGLGVHQAIDTINNTIASKIIGMDIIKQQHIDKALIELDGTQNKAKLGANTLLSISMAVAKAGAATSVLPLFLYLREFINKEQLSLKMPSPMITIMSGGKTGTINRLDFQDFLLLPASSKPFPDALQIGWQVANSLKNTLANNNFSVLTGLTGGYEPDVKTNYNALTIISEAIENTIYRLGYDLFLGFDAAANTFYKDREYVLRDKSSSYTTKQLISFYYEMIKKFHLLYMEDPLAEDDWDGWTEAIQQLSTDIIVAGDDLTATNPYRLQMAIDKKAITGIVIKPNQIGTVIESLAVMEVAREAELKIIVSSRSGETNDDFIADFAVAVSADYVKFGALQRGEHIAKYNRLLQINERLKVL